MSRFRLPRDRERLGRWRFEGPLPAAIRQLASLGRRRDPLEPSATAYLGREPLARVEASLREAIAPDGLNVELTMLVSVHPRLWWARTAAPERLLHAVLDVAAAWPWGVSTVMQRGPRGFTVEVWTAAPPGLSRARAWAVAGTALALATSGVPAPEAIDRAREASQPTLASGSGKERLGRTWRRVVGRVEPQPGLEWVVDPGVLLQALALGGALGGFAIEPVVDSRVFAPGHFAKGAGGIWWVAGYMLADELSGRVTPRVCTEGPEPTDYGLAVLGVWPEKALLVPRMYLSGRGGDASWRLMGCAFGIRLDRVPPDALAAVWRRAVAMAASGTAPETVAAWLSGLSDADAQNLAGFEALAAL
ncbi:hypothetical protein [Thermaerobacter litoralis]